MASRPRRSAAQKASVAITDMADRDNMSTSRSRRSGDGLASVSRGSQGGKDHTYLTVKLPSSKLRQATSSKQGSSISVNNDSTPKRSTRGGKKSYVVESESDDEEDDEEGEDEIQVGAPAVGADDEGDDEDDEDDDEEMNDVDEDAEGEEVEEEMDLDAEGEEDEGDEGDADAEGEDDVDMDMPAPAPTIKIQKPSKRSPESKKTKDATPRKASAQASALNESDDDELSELESDEEMEGEEDAEGEEDEEDMDAEGEEIEEDQDGEGEPEPNAEPGQVGGEIDSGDESAAPNKTRMTVRQRARFEDLDESHYQALSNGTYFPLDRWNAPAKPASFAEVQAKKVFTVEEKAMRRAEMARRRRNLSEKRNEEVKVFCNQGSSSHEIGTVAADTVPACSKRR
jgi:Ino eighty subunit 2